MKIARTMSKHKRRMSEIGKYAVPPDGTKKLEDFDRWVDEIGKDPGFRKEIKKRFKHASAIILAQLENGAGFPIDQQIRFFLQEFNDRNIRHGLSSMPSSFNVMEAFFQYNPAYSFFKLRKESDHLLSFTEFLDYVTSPDSTDDIKRVLQYIEEGVIYSYNIVNDPGDITFSTKNGIEYGVGGFSFIRYGSEINILLLAGEKTDVVMKSRELQSKETGSPAPGREMLHPSDDRKREAVPLLNNNNFWQVLVLTRMDIDDMTQNVRYVLKDVGDGFVVITDDIGILVDQNGDFLMPEHEQLSKEMINDIEIYYTLFEVCKTALHLPLYFEHYGDLVVEERHQSRFGENSEKGKWILRNKLLTLYERIKFRQVSVLRKDIGRQPDNTIYKAPDFKIDVSGFWRKLPIGQIGADKYGRPIHGRTWVHKTLTWIENQDQDAVHVKYYKSHSVSDIVKEEANKGYIYVMRSAAHNKDIFKIGLTRHPPEIRSDQLSSTTGSPDKFMVVQEWVVSDCVKAEDMIHEALSEYRINPKREFFKAPYKKIVEIINQIILRLEKN